MKNKKMTVTMVVIFVVKSTILCAGGSCGTAEEHNQLATGDTVYSINRYDGTRSWARFSTEKLALSNDTIKSENNPLAHYVSQGFITFSLGGITPEKTIDGLRIYMIDSDPCPPETRQEVEIIELVVSQDDYLTWQDCYTTTYPLDEVIFVPAGCQFPPGYQTSEVNIFLLNQEIINDQPTGWWVTDSLEFATFINNRSKNLVTFEVNYLCRYTYLRPDEKPLAIFEDGGNNGGTGNLPRLEITY